MDDALQSWQRSCDARERFYIRAEANAGAADAYSVAACMAILKSMALDPSLFFEDHEHVHITRMANHVYDHGTGNEVLLDPQFVRSLVIPQFGLR